MMRVNPAVGVMDESVIRDMTRVAENAEAVNLAQGYPEYPTPEPVRDAAIQAIREGLNSYTRTWGDRRSTARPRTAAGASSACPSERVSP